MRRNNRDRKNFTMYNETLYEVERVVKLKWIKNKQYCLIKWKGYDDRFNTWEPKDHITFCYNYLADKEIEDEDDPEYVENLPIAPNTSPTHHYQTRRKNRSHENKETYGLEECKSDVVIEEKTENSSPRQERKWEGESNTEEVVVRKKGENWQGSNRMVKDSIVSRIISLSVEKENSKPIGKVEMSDGRIAFILEDILKTRFPQKVIEYYEFKLAQPH